MAPRIEFEDGEPSSINANGTMGAQAAAAACFPAESTPLVLSGPTEIDKKAGSPDEENQLSDVEDQIPKSILYDELRGMIELSVPVVATYLMEMLPGLVSIILVGHTRGSRTEEYIDATALAVMFMNLIGLSIGIGLATAMDTLCSQAFGAKETIRMGTYFQTGIAVMSVTYIFVCIMFFFCTDILIALGQPAMVAELSGSFALYLLPGIPFIYLYELLRKVLQAQNIAKPMFCVAALANVVNVVLGYVLVYHTSFGWMGAAVARTACNISLPLLLLPYMINSGLVKTFWSGFRPYAALQGIGEFLSLGVPGMLQLCFEWWAFETLALLSGLLPNAVTSIGANSVVLNIASMAYMFYLGISISGNVRIGNALGAGLPKRASLAAQLTIGMAVLMALILAAVLLLFRTQIPVLFTHDANICELTQSLIVVSALFQIPDAINAGVQGIFRGSGRQSLGAKLNFVAFYTLGIPLGCALAFGLRQGVVGLWVGVTAGLCLVALSGTVMISCSDWVSLSEEAKGRIQIGG